MELEELYGKFYKEIITYCTAMTKNRASAESVPPLRPGVTDLPPDCPCGPSDNLRSSSDSPQAEPGCRKIF